MNYLQGHDTVFEKGGYYRWQCMMKIEIGIVPQIN